MLPPLLVMSWRPLGEMLPAMMLLKMFTTEVPPTERDHAAESLIGVGEGRIVLSECAVVDVQGASEEADPAVGGGFVAVEKVLFEIVPVPARWLIVPTVPSPVAPVTVLLEIVELVMVNEVPAAAALLNWKTLPAPVALLPLIVVFVTETTAPNAMPATRRGAVALLFETMLLLIVRLPSSPPELKVKTPPTPALIRIIARNGRVRDRDRRVALGAEE